MKRRGLLVAAAATVAAPWAGLSGCGRVEPAPYAGGWVGMSDERGHRLRVASKSGALPAPAVTRRAGAVVVGAGVAGLGAARALMRAGIDDVQIVELEDAPGGNSRGHAIAGMRCPLGAHYLPLPGERAEEVVELLEELGLRRSEYGRPVYDERSLCHSPQERLFIGGAWRDGLLPPLDALPAGERGTTLAQYRAFAAAVAEAAGSTASSGGAFSSDAFSIPTARSRWSPALAALDAETFAAWLDGRGLTAPALRWYLDYCCRDDYGAGSRQVSAWAGLHYFASRHGFQAPGADGADAEGEGVLTWPEGNAFLAERLAAPLGDRLRTGCVVLRVQADKEAVSVDAWNVAAGRHERWSGAQVVLATPLFVSARLLQSPPDALVEAAGRIRPAPWLVANLHLDAALDDRPGAPPSWDNVLFDGGAGALGYVDAMHQSLRPVAGPTVLTAYRALGGDTPAELAAGRAALLQDGWATWAGRVVGQLAPAHPDLPAKLRRADLTRYGHAMGVPLPGLRGSAALAALAAPHGRVHFAHADLSAYSVFEEALYHGMRAGRQAARALHGINGRPGA